VIKAGFGRSVDGLSLAKAMRFVLRQGGAVLAQRDVIVYRANRNPGWWGVQRGETAALHLFGVAWNACGWSAQLL